MRSLASAAALLLVLASVARADEPGALTRAPVVLEPATPAYPPDARTRGLSGEVVLEVDISASGQVLDARVVRAAGEGFDEAALAAARMLRFAPAEIDGKPAAVTIEYRFRFDAPPPAPAPAEASLAEARPGGVLRGVLLERGTRRPIAGASVSAGEATTSTDGAGQFEITGLSFGAVKVVATDPAYHRFETEETIAEGKALEVKYYLRRDEQNAYEAVVVGERERKEVTSVTVTTGEVTRLAGVSGDTVRVIQNLPGVARQPGGFGALIVRGGNPNDTRVYVDGVEVPQIFHFEGLTSVVSSDLVESVDFEAGNFGVRYGRATGGRVDLKTRDPGSKQLHVVADSNLYHALALVEGPATENVSVAIAARRSYVDAVLSAAASSSDKFSISVAPRYYDYQGKLTWRATENDVVRLSLIGSDDRIELTGVDTGTVRNLDRLQIGTFFTQAIASWDHRFSDAARAKVSLAQGLVDIDNRFGDFGRERERFPITSARAEVSRDLGSALTLAAGFDGRFLPTSTFDLEFPAIPAANQIPDPDPHDIRYRSNLQAWEAGFWAEATWKPVERLTLVPGVRLEREVLINRMTWVDPRLSIRYAVRDGTTLKGGAGLYHQPPIVPYMMKEWGNPDLREEGAWHFMTGVEQRIAGPVSLDLQLYYKRLFDLALPTDSVIERDGQLVPERYTNAGTGKSYGAELLLRWNPGGRFFGWIAYSLSRSKRDQSVVGGTLAPTGDAYDQPQNLVAVGTIDLPEVWRGFSTGFRLRYTTGNPYRRTTSAVYDADSDAYAAVQEASLGGRAPDFFQLDLRFDKRWTWKTWILSAYLEVQNVTNRKNPETIAYNYDYTKSGWATGLPFFPSFGIRAEY